MPKVTQLPFINSGTTATSFFVVDDRSTKRLKYADFVDRVISEVQQANFMGPTGPAGPASTVPGPTGPSGPSGEAGIGLPLGGLAGQVLAKVADTDYIVDWVDSSGTSGSGGIGLSRRILSTATSGVISVGISASAELVGFKTYILSKVETNYPAWVRIYADSNSRTADASRSEDQDPLPGSGIIAEVITTSGSLTQLITPGVIGFNNDSVTSSTVYLSITNNDTVSRNVSVTLTLLQMES
jgi:hypothetical protein